MGDVQMTKDNKKDYIVSREDWSLHRKGYQDQQRHMEKVREAIKNNLPDLISEESIIMSNGREVIKIPIRTLDEYKIRYNYGKTKHVGQGQGNSKIGDIVARDSQGAHGPGKGKEAGNLPGVDYYEAEVSLEEVQNILFSELELPNLEQKEQSNITTEKIEFNDIRKKGLMGNIDKKRTILSAMKRNALRKGKAQIAPITEEDLRFKTWNEVVKPESNAVVLAMMDTSGSMGNFEKYCARTFFFWMTRFLRSKYEKVEIEFIAHSTEAKVVTEEEFFTKGESGGTICSSAYLKALELIKIKYSPSRYNIYPVHFSDGENMSSDNEKCLKLVNQLMEVSQMFGYGEVNALNRYSTLLNTFKNIDNPKFRHYVIRQKSDVYEALKSMFRKQEANA